MGEICIVPAYRRPEMLYLCLERLAMAEERQQVSIRVVVDSHVFRPHKFLEREVVRAFPSLNVRYVERKPHAFPGNSYNVLTAYKEALADNPELVYLVEEDVMVTPDFFRWHRAAQASGDWFCAVAATNTRTPLPPIEDAGLIYPSKKDFASLGVSWRPEKLAQVTAHATPRYLASQEKYCQQVFGNLPAGQPEQDGLILRVMLQAGELSVWPRVPRAFHVGYYSDHYTWGCAPQGSWREKVKALRQIIADQERLMSVTRHYRHAVKACKFHVPGWQSLQIEDPQAALC